MGQKIREASNRVLMPIERLISKPSSIRMK
jgi:hypothetical protein